MFQKVFDQLGNEYNEINKALKEGKLVDAFEFCKKKVGPEADIIKSMILVLLKKNIKALEILKELEIDNLKLISKDIYYELIGLCYYEMKNYLESTRYFLKALKLNENNFYAKYNLANIYLLKKDYKKAYEYLIDLKKIEPENDNIKENLKLLKKYL